MNSELARRFLLQNFLDLVEKREDNLTKIRQIVLKSRMKRRRVLAMCNRTFRLRRKVTKTSTNWRTMRVMPDDIFSRDFQMKKDTFEKLRIMLQPLLTDQETGRPSIPLEKCLYVTLWKLVNEKSFREVGDKFNISPGTTHRVFVHITKLLSGLKRHVIKFPNTEASQHTTMEEFKASRSHPFPFVLGCVGGMHIQISQPTKDSNSFYNSKGSYSIVVQAIVDSKMRFIDVFAGYPGRYHNGCIWQNSPIRKAITNKTIQIPPEAHLLANVAYPLENCLMVPYKDNGFLTEKQKNFNSVHSSTRVSIEQAFATLKKKFRILNFLEIQNLHLAKDIIFACMVLHNVIINNEGTNCENDPMEDQNVYMDDVSTKSTFDENEAARKRNSIATLLSAECI